jgi:hypothetical protein
MAIAGNANALAADRTLSLNHAPFVMVMASPHLENSTNKTRSGMTRTITSAATNAGAKVVSRFAYRRIDGARATRFLDVGKFRVPRPNGSRFQR